MTGISIVSGMAIRKSNEKQPVFREIGKLVKFRLDTQDCQLAEIIFNGNRGFADKIIAKKYSKRVSLPFEVLFDYRDLKLVIANYGFFKKLFKEKL